MVLQRAFVNPACRSMHDRQHALLDNQVFNRSRGDVLFPDLVSVFIAVDPCTRRNGCLQVIRGSHKLGRVDHSLTGDQAGADLERVEKVLERLPLVHVEMRPGDALFFHPNTLHRSDRNASPDPRWSLICCYNARHNDPYKDSHHPRYTPLSKVDDRMIREVGVRRFADDPGDVAWLDPDRDASGRSPATERPATGDPASSPSPSPFGRGPG